MNNFFYIHIKTILLIYKRASRKIKIILLLGAITLGFFSIMISFAFPDLFAMYYVPNKVWEQNIYSWVNMYKHICPWVSATWPPLYYYTMGFYLSVIKLFGFIDGALFATNACPVYEMLVDKAFLFWAKLPFFVFHFASAWLFSSFFKRGRFLWFLFWLLNPVAIFVNFIEGQFDSIPTFFLLLGLYFGIVRKYPYLSALALGVGAVYKHYPFLLIIPFAIVLMDTLRKRLLFIIASFVPYMISVAFSLNNDFLQSLTFGENYKMFEGGYYVRKFKNKFLYYLLYATSIKTRI